MIQATTWQNKHNECAPSELRSAWACAQSDQSSLSARRNLGDLATRWAHSEDSDQTGRMPRLSCLRWAHTHFVGFVMSWLNYNYMYVYKMKMESGEKMDSFWWNISWFVWSFMKVWGHDIKKRQLKGYMLKMFISDVSLACGVNTIFEQRLPRVNPRVYSSKKQKCFKYFRQILCLHNYDAWQITMSLLSQ